MSCIFWAQLVAFQETAAPTCGLFESLSSFSNKYKNNNNNNKIINKDVEVIYGDQVYIS